MRVIAGRFRSRRLKSLPGMAVRPTPDRMRESLFSILAGRVEGAVFLDAYAGTGSVGVEALSRGAKHVIFVERDARARAVLMENLKALEIGTEEATVLAGRAVEKIAQIKAEIAFVDPPYESAGEYPASLMALSENGCALAMAQHPSKLALEGRYGELAQTRVLKQGDNSVTFYERL